MSATSWFDLVSENFSAISAMLTILFGGAVSIVSVYVTNVWNSRRDEALQRAALKRLEREHHLKRSVEQSDWRRDQIVDGIVATNKLVHGLHDWNRDALMVAYSGYSPEKEIEYLVRCREYRVSCFTKLDLFCSEVSDTLSSFCGAAEDWGVAQQRAIHEIQKLKEELKNVVDELTGELEPDDIYELEEKETRKINDKVNDLQKKLRHHVDETYALQDKLHGEVREVLRGLA